MLRKFINITLGCLLLLSLSNCQRQENTKVPEKKESSKPKTNTSTSATINTSVPATKTTTENVPEASVKSNPKTTTATSPKKEPQSVKAHVHYKIYNNVQILLGILKTGQTMTKEQLMASNKLPTDALKTVKSITKVSENELAIKWKSKWMLEKISDVRLKDDKIKIQLKNGLVYTSGDAIGIECDDKVYTNLTIKGDKAYIPSIKGYSWKIGS